MKYSFIVIGLDDGPNPSFPDSVREVIARSRVFSGGARHRQVVQGLLPEGAEWLPVKVPLQDLWPVYEAYFASHEEPLVVFASGDPLFFGLANTLKRVWPQAEMKVWPCFNSLQMLAHRLTMRYDDMHTVSLTGRPWKGLDEALMRGWLKIGLLTDRTHTPAAIAQRMLDYGYVEYEMWVGERMGNPDLERVRRLSLPEAAGLTFEAPNCVMVVADKPRGRCFGIPDEEFSLLDGRKRMITKMPIRLLSLQALDLCQKKVLWDVGFCTGSVSIEAQLQFPQLTVCSFEVREQCRDLLQVNSRRFGALGLEPIIGDFLEVDLKEVPAPDAVFVGGHGGRLRAIMERVLQHLVPGGCIVMNAVSAESVNLFMEAALALDLCVTTECRVAVDDYNPITILKAVRRE